MIVKPIKRVTKRLENATITSARVITSLNAMVTSLKNASITNMKRSVRALKARRATLRLLDVRQMHAKPMNTVATAKRSANAKTINGATNRLVPINKNAIARKRLVSTTNAKGQPTHAMAKPSNVAKIINSSKSILAPIHKNATKP